MKQQPIVAFLYDFDKTLCTTDMQDYAFIPSLGMTPAEFWAEANGFGRRNRMDGILAYMYTMLREAARRNRPFTRTDLVEKGRSIVLFPGVEDWFRRINDFGAGQGVQVEHYIISSGLREIIEGSSISGEFKEIYASEFYYDESGVPVWPKLAVNFTAKTQFVYRINKGVLDVSNDRDLNASMPDDSKRVPFTSMIYMGDGLSDVPCMKMMRAYGGPGHRRVPGQQPRRCGGPAGKGPGGLYLPGGLPGRVCPGGHGAGHHPQNGGDGPLVGGECPPGAQHRWRRAAGAGGPVLSWTARKQRGKAPQRLPPKNV